MNGKAGAVLAAIIAVIAVVAVLGLVMYRQGMVPGLGPSSSSGAGGGGGGAVRIVEYSATVYPREVTEDETPIHLTLVVESELPVGTRVGGELGLFFDGLKLASITIPEQSLDPGTNELEVTVILDNALLDEAWYRHLKNNEKSTLVIEGFIEATKHRVKIPFKYTTRVSTSIFPYTVVVDKKYDLGALGTVTVEKAVVKLGEARLTETVFNVEVYVKNNLRVPLVVKGIVFEAVLRDGTVIARGEQEEPQTIARGETGRLLFRVILDNGKIPLIWYKHLKNGEKTEVDLRIWLRGEVAGRQVELLEKNPVIVKIIVETSLFKHQS